MIKITNGEDSINLDKELITIEDDNYISLEIPIYWIKHKDNCDSCNSFFNKLSNKNSKDWFITIDNVSYKMDFMDNSYIGNGGDDTILSTDDIDIKNINMQCMSHTEAFNIKNIKLHKISIDVNRDIKLHELLNSDVTSKTINTHTNIFTEISKDTFEQIISNRGYVKIPIGDIESITLKLEIKKES